MIVSRLNADALAAIPAEVLDALGLKPGDPIGFEIEDGEVRLTRPDEAAFQQFPTEEAEPGTETLRWLIHQALDDPRPTVPAAEAFASIRRRFDARWAADDD